MSWFKIQKDEVELFILAKPNAKKSAILATAVEELKIALHAKPHQGEANTELISYLSKLFRVPKSRILLRRGENSRHKTILLPLTDTVRAFIDDPMKWIKDAET